MGRPKLYHTEEERRAAARKRRMKYYYNNKEAGIVEGYTDDEVMILRREISLEVLADMFADLGFPAPVPTTTELLLILARRIERGS